MSNKTKGDPIMCDWLRTHWPNARVVDHDWTMKRYDYPQRVIDWIKNNWIKMNDDNGGTYYEPNYHARRYPTADEEASKKFTRNLQGTNVVKGMDEANRAALQVMANEGSDAAARHMLTDQKTGSTRSYAEMRMLYG